MNELRIQGHRWPLPYKECSRWWSDNKDGNIQFCHPLPSKTHRQRGGCGCGGEPDLRRKHRPHCLVAKTPIANSQLLIGLECKADRPTSLLGTPAGVGQFRQSKLIIKKCWSSSRQLCCWKAGHPLRGSFALCYTIPVLKFAFLTSWLCLLLWELTTQPRFRLT